jgi:hypothetical protein
MKGIAHFASGLAVATFFPEIVYGASQNLSLAPLLGGAAGLLPDTLDFKVVRYFSRLDEEIDPAKITDAAGRPDPEAIAAGSRVAAWRQLAVPEALNVRSRRTDRAQERPAPVVRVGRLGNCCTCSEPIGLAPRCYLNDQDDKLGFLYRIGNTPITNSDPVSLVVPLQLLAPPGPGIPGQGQNLPVYPSHLVLR